MRAFNILRNERISKEYKNWNKNKNNGKVFSSFKWICNFPQGFPSSKGILLLSSDLAVYFRGRSFIFQKHHLLLFDSSTRCFSRHSNFARPRIYFSCEFLQQIKVSHCSFAPLRALMQNNKAWHPICCEERKQTSWLQTIFVGLFISQFKRMRNWTWSTPCSTSKPIWQEFIPQRAEKNAWAANIYMI